jgi:carboxypeptidase family protein
MRGTTYLAIGCLSLFAACGGPRSATSPTPTTAAPRIVTLRLDGRVSDTTGRPVRGATVEMIDGVPAGLEAITDDSGSFSLGDVTLTIGTTKIRASKDGYATSPWTNPPNAPPHSEIGITLALLTPPLIRPGEYTMSFVADSACDLPGEARTRTYSATIASLPGDVNQPPEQQGTALNVALSGASFVVGEDISPTNSVSMNVAGDFVTIVLDPYDFGGYITERLAPATYLDLAGKVAGSVGASGTFSLPLDGKFYYCVKQSADIVIPLGSGRFGCSTNDLVYKNCSSKNHRVMLTRR